MNIYYATSPLVIESLELDEISIVFVPDTFGSNYSKHWDDFGYKTNCNVYVIENNKSTQIGHAKLLLEDELHTHEKIKNIMGTDKYINFSCLNINFLTLAADIDFYSKISNKISPIDITEYLKNARDAGYIKIRDTSKLFKSTGFEDSLLREMGARKALNYARKIFSIADYNDIEFTIKYKLDSYDAEHIVPLDFTDGFYPSNINILIGANGTGKTHGLFTLMQDMLDIGDSRIKRKAAEDSSLKPFFSNIVCFSYSPFEDIGEVVGESDIRSTSIFKSFGFYIDGKFNKDSPLIAAVESLFEIVKKDIADEEFDINSERINVLIDIMHIGIPNFDDIGIVIKTNDDREEVISAGGNYKNLLEYEDIAIKECGIVYLKEGCRLKLSSGQSMFSTLVIGALSHIKEETLLVFDEPELHLHPSLEIVLLRMLRTLLERYSSYAVISTHSSVLAREVPQRCTCVLKRRDNAVIIERPPFETFGASMDRITAYVFDDAKGHKKYHDFLDKTYANFGNFENTMNAAKDQLNEESILYLMGKE